jgi:hypothetical protein
MMARTNVKFLALGLADDASWCSVVGARLRKKGVEQELEQDEQKQVWRKSTSQESWSSGSIRLNLSLQQKLHS